jgi:hypothetical protein
VSALATVAAPAPVSVPVSAPVDVPAPAKPVIEIVPAPAPRCIDSLDVLFNKIILNSSLLSTVHDLKHTGFTNASIPRIILSIMTTYNSYTTTTPSHALTVDDIQVLLERVYNYLVDTYNLIDVTDRLSMYNLFELSLKLCLETPNIKKEVVSCLKFFRCNK